MADKSVNLETRLQEIVCATPWLMRALRAVGDVDMPDGYICSGAVRNAVWDTLHNYSKPSFLADIDVGYFDPRDLSETSEKEYERQLKEIEPELPWDVKNQAAVHLWFHKLFGHCVEPLSSIADAVSSWPEPAVCVAVRLNADDRMEVIAPLGLDDLFGMVVRRNPKRVSIETYNRRQQSKRYTERWPLVHVL